MADRILGSAATDRRAQTTVRAGIEWRSTGDMAVTQALAFGQTEAGAAVPASLLPALTLRAAGDLSIYRHLSSGLLASDGQPVTPVAAQAGALRLVAGADLGAALPTAVQASPAAGSLVIGGLPPDAFSPPPAVRVANSTGDLVLAAAGDVRLRNAAAAAYTTGRAWAGPASAADAVAQAFNGLGQGLLTGGGSLTVQAGGQVVGQPGSDFITDWWWRTESGGWYARINDRFATGLATFGGGDLTVTAGGDIRNLDAVAANSGVAPVGTAGGPAVVAGGGSVRWRAGGDIASGLASASGGDLSVQAGGSIVASAQAGAYNGLQLDHQATRVRVEALGSARIGSLKSAGLIEPHRDNPVGQVVTGLDNGAEAALYAWSGDLVYEARRSDVTGAHNGDSALTSVVPARTQMAAPLGNVTLGDANAGVVLRPTDGASRLQVLAGRDLVLGAVTLQPVGDAETPHLRDLASVPVGEMGLSGTSAAASAASVAAPLQLVAQAGDLRLVAPVQSARPARLLAGRDLSLTQNASLLLVHPGDGLSPVSPASPLSLLQAGRDIVVGSSQTAAAGTVEVRGPGDLLLVAGRRVDLGKSGGVVSRGNLDDTLGLPSGGADITVLAGVTLDDLALASRRGFALVGGAVAARPDLLAGLLALRSGSAADATTAADAAQAFADAAPTAQLDTARTLLGGSFDTALRRSLGVLVANSAAAAQQVLAAVGGSAAPGSTTTDAQSALADGTLLAGAGQAARAFGALGTLDQRRIVGQVMASGYDALPAPVQQQWLLALARSGEVSADYLQRLSARVGVGADDPAAALAAHAALPPERQWLLAAQVLRDELRASGRAAAGIASTAFDPVTIQVTTLRGYQAFDAAALAEAPGQGVATTLDRPTAYARGYAAMDTLFGGARSAGSVEMTTSQVKTQQQGSITLLTPGGGVNAGALASAGTVDPNRQGIVTVAGGDITAAVRDDFAVNQSRVFTLARGDVLLWSSEGNLDAGRGAKTVRGAPKPVYGLDRNGNVTVDTSGAFTGSGIAVLDAGSALDLYAAKGEINAGEAGISSAGRATLAAQSFAGFDNVRFSLGSSGGPPPVSTVGATAGLASLAPPPAAAAARDTASDDKDDDKRRKKRRNLFLDFLGFGPGG